MMSEAAPLAPLQRLPRLLVVGSFLPGFELERYAGGALTCKWVQAGGTAIVTSRSRSRGLRLLDMLGTALWRRNDYDLIHITVFSGLAFRYAEALAWMSAFLGKPLTLSLHGGNLPVFAVRHPARVRRLLGKAVAVACPSRFLLEALTPFRPDIQLIANAIDLSRYRFVMPRPLGSRLLWLRAFHNIYNPMLAPAVLARLVEILPDATLTMVGPDKGDGTYEATRRVALDCGVLDRVRFTGPMPKDSIAQLLGDHDIFLNTTNVDNVPISVIEALACGLPVVSTNVGGLPYLLEHERTALLVPPANVDEMAAAVARLAAQPALAEMLSENGRRLAESFDWSIVLPLWQHQFSNAVRGFSGKS